MFASSLIIPPLPLPRALFSNPGPKKYYPSQGDVSIASLLLCTAVVPSQDQGADGLPSSDPVIPQTASTRKGLHQSWRSRPGPFMHGGRLRPVCAASASRAWAPGPWEQLPCAQLSETAGHCAKIEFLQCHGHRAAGPDRLKCWAERGHRLRQGLHSGKAGRCSL